MRQRVRLAVVALLLLLASAVVPRAGTTEAAFEVTLAAGSNLRAGPGTRYAVAGFLQRGTVVDVVRTVSGQPVVPGNSTWFVLPSGRYIYSGQTTAGGGATASSAGMTGRWIEVDRSSLVARAVENGRVVYTAYVTLGTPSYPTPVGTFSIYRRVANETMDSATIGIPRNSPDGYYLNNVLYTQYFVDGVALHYNYWSAPEAFGNYPGSHGCVGMTLADSQLYWNFATIGTPVIITN